MIVVLTGGTGGAKLIEGLAAEIDAAELTIICNTGDDAVSPVPGFTVWPATSPAGQYATDAGGTEYLLSSIAGDGSETGNPTGTARRIGMWALTNTSSLNSPAPDLRVTSRLTNSETYVFPPKSNQR